MSSSILGAFKNSQITRAMVKMKKKISPTTAVGYRSSKKRKDASKFAIEAEIDQVVFPSNKPAIVNEKTKFIEKTMTMYRKELYDKKVRQLDAMSKNMQKAMVELEKSDVRLFKLALEKEEGNYFPLERRFMVDSPGTPLWKSK